MKIDIMTLEETMLLVDQFDDTCPEMGSREGELLEKYSLKLNILQDVMNI